MKLIQISSLALTLCTNLVTAASPGLALGQSTSSELLDQVKARKHHLKCHHKHHPTITSSLAPITTHESTTSKAVEPTPDPLPEIKVCVAPTGPKPKLLSCTPNINLSANATSDVSCVLTQKPTGPAIVHFTLPEGIAGNKGLSLPTCSLEFSETNWDTPQIIKVASSYLPNTLASAAFAIDYLVESKTDAFHICDGKIEGTRAYDTTRAATMCSVAGDPHVITFSDFPSNPLKNSVSGAARIYHGSWDKQMEMFVKGQYNLVKSEAGLLIQGTYDYCGMGSSTAAPGSLMSCLTKLALQFEDDSLIISYTKTGNKTKLSVSTKSSGNSILVDQHTDGLYMTIRVKDGVNGFTDGTLIKVITEIYDNKVFYVSTLIKLSPLHYKKVQGHCNVWDDTYVQSTTSRDLFCGNKKWTVLRNESKKNLKDFLEWTECHKVTSAENAFTQSSLIAMPSLNKNTCAAPVLLSKCDTKDCPLCGCSSDEVTYVTKRSIPIAAELPAQSSDVTSRKFASEFPKYDPCAEGECNKLEKVSFVSSSASVKVPTAEEIETAANECLKFFGLSASDSIMSSDNYIDSCVSDYLLSNSHVFSESHRQMYLTGLEGQVSEMRGKNLTSAESNKLNFISSKFSLGAYECSNSCSGHGTCSSSGCQCASGFGGHDCSSDLRVNQAKLAAQSGSLRTFASTLVLLGSLIAVFI